MKNRYISRSKITEKKFKQMLKLFCLDLNASQISEITGIHRNTVNRYLTEIRRRISRRCLRHTDHPAYAPFDDPTDLFGKSSDTSMGYVSFLGLAKENGNIRSRVLSNHVGSRLWHALTKTNGEEKIHGIGDAKYLGGLIHLGKMKYVRIRVGDSSTGESSHGIDICEGFWGFVRSRRQHFRGLKRSTLLLHIRECEFRYNYSREDIFSILLEDARKHPLFL